jgi:hypothetical protein
MNISNPIQISYIWDQENFEKSFENAYTYHYKNSYRRYLGWFFIALAQFGVVAALKKGHVGLLMLSTILILYWYVGKKWLVKKRALSSFEKSPLKNKMITLTVSEEGIDQNGTFIPWDEIEGVVDAGEDLMLYLSGKSYYIPSSGFEGIEAKSRFKTIAKEKGKLYV